MFRHGHLCSATAIWSLLFWPFGTSFVSKRRDLLEQMDTISGHLLLIIPVFTHELVRGSLADEPFL
jgi:hypothetical protein